MARFLVSWPKALISLASRSSPSAESAVPLIEEDHKVKGVSMFAWILAPIHWFRVSLANLVPVSLNRRFAATVFVLLFGAG